MMRTTGAPRFVRPATPCLYMPAGPVWVTRRSHTYPKIAECYIYAEISLYDDLSTVDPREGLRTSKCAQIIVKNPNITNYIRSLKVYVKDSEAVPEQPKAMATHLNNVASMLPTFSRLKKMTLSGLYIHQSRFISRISWHYHTARNVLSGFSAPPPCSMHGRHLYFLCVLPPLVFVKQLQDP